MQAVLFSGLQASGKSSFYKERFFRTHIRINLDMLRTRHREKILLEACIAAKQKFVIDNTNPTAETRSPYIAAAKEASFEIVGYFFCSSAQECIERNARRPKEEVVPDVAIYGTAKKLEPPTWQEGFDRLFCIQLSKEGFQVTEQTRDGKEPDAPNGRAVRKVDM